MLTFVAGSASCTAAAAAKGDHICVALCTSLLAQAVLYLVVFVTRCSLCAAMHSCGDAM